jgi:hypothetical protein
VHSVWPQLRIGKRVVLALHHTRGKCTVRRADGVRTIPSEALHVSTFRSRLRPQGLRVTPPRVLAVALLLVLATVVALWRNDVPNALRATALIAHVGLGLLIAPLALFTLYEIYKQRRRAFPIGHALVLATGTVVLIVGGDRRFAVVLAIHAAVGAAFFAWSLFPRRVAFLGAPLAFVIVGLAVHERAKMVPPTEEPIASVGDALESGALSLDTSALIDDHRIRFVDDTRCSACHEKLIRAHRSGGHGARVASAFTAERSATVVRSAAHDVARCDACHDVPRQIDDVTPTSASVPSEREGQAPLPCLTCHGASSTRVTSSGTVLALALPDDPVVTTDGLLLSFARVLTHIDARAHRARMRTTTTRATMSCVTCHSATAHAALVATSAVNDEAPSTTDPVAGHWPLEAAGPSSPLRAPARVCVDCHAHDLSALRPRLALALFHTDMKRETSPLIDADTPLTFANDEIALDLLITNENAGHGFPASAFARAVTVVVDVLASDGSPFPNGAALTLHPRPLGARRADERTLVFDEPLAPGRGQTVRLHLPLTTGRAPVRVHVRLLTSDREGLQREIASTRDARVLAAPVLLARYADALARVDHRVDATRALAWAEETAPGDLDVKLARARFLIERDANTDGALALLANEHDVHSCYLRAHALLVGARDVDARAILDDLSRLAPFDVDVALAFAGVLVDARENERATRVLAVALAGNPGHARLLDAARVVVNK